MGLAQDCSRMEEEVASKEGRPLRVFSGGEVGSLEVHFSAKDQVLEQVGCANLVAERSKGDHDGAKVERQRMPPTLAMKSSQAESPHVTPSIEVLMAVEWCEGGSEPSTLTFCVPTIDKAIWRRRIDILALGSSYLRPLSPGCQLLKLLLQDGGLLELSEEAARVPSGKELVIKTEEMERPRDVEFDCVAEEEGDIEILPNGFVSFSNCLGMPISGFEKEICSLFRKMESR